MMTAVAGSSLGCGHAFVALALVAVSIAPSMAHQVADIPVVRLEGTGDRQPTQPRTLPVTRLDDGDRTADLDGTTAVSMTFAAPLPVGDVLLLLFRSTPFSVVFDPGISATFIGELSGLTLRQALEAVLVPAALDYELKGRVIRVFPRRPQTRLFEVSHVDVKRRWQRRIRSLTSANESLPAAELSATVESDFFQQLTEGIRSLLSSSGRVHVDRTAGVVQVTDFADRLDQVGVYVETITLRATRQVRLDARVLQVTLNAEVASIDWGTVASRAGVPAGSGAGLRVADVNVLLQAIGEFGDVRVIAAPQVLAMNNEPAVMRVGSEQAVFVKASAQPLAITEGLTLSITPQIGADGIVHMSISPTWTGTRRGGSGAHADRSPSSIVELDTTMRVRGGETVVIAGLLREAEESVSAGGLSGIFGAKDRKTNRAELVILLTPTVVSASSAMAGAQ
jgi:MSHA biogenesis protein MshL